VDVRSVISVIGRHFLFFCVVWVLFLFSFLSYLRKE
jgi:hypothetical protein